MRRTTLAHTTTALLVGVVVALTGCTNEPQVTVTPDPSAEPPASAGDSPERDAAAAEAQWQSIVREAVSQANFNERAPNRADLERAVADSSPAYTFDDGDQVVSAAEWLVADRDAPHALLAMPAWMDGSGLVMVVSVPVDGDASDVTVEFRDYSTADVPTAQDSLRHLADVPGGAPSTTAAEEPEDLDAYCAAIQAIHDEPYAGPGRPSTGMAEAAADVLPVAPDDEREFWHALSAVYDATLDRDLMMIVVDNSRSMRALIDDRCGFTLP